MAAVDIVGAVAFALVALVALLVFIVVIEILAAMLTRAAQVWPAIDRPRVAVIVPAHNEEAGIGRTVKQIGAQLADGDRLIVVADNCSDATRLVASDAGAEVISRDEPDRRGKGFAMQFGIRHLAKDAPEVVIFIDADCTVAPETVARLAILSKVLERPVQARDDMLSPSGGGSPGLAIASFAWRVKNHIRPLGLRNLGLPSQLMGTGMAFPWSVISKARLGTADITEDLALGLQLARAGAPAIYCPEVSVSSEFPLSGEGQQAQRARWETGHLNIIARIIPGLVIDAIRARNLALLILVADAAVPPLALLSLMIAALLLICTAVAAFGGPVMPLLMILVSGALFATCLALAWWKVGRDILSLSDISRIPAYVIHKARLYPRVLAGRKIGWIRAKRD